MLEKTILGVVAAAVLTSVGVASAIEQPNSPAYVKVRQASVGELDVQLVAGNPNLLMAYFEPASWAYGPWGQEQYNVDIWNNMSSYEWASSYSVPNDFQEVGSGFQMATPELQTDESTQTPIHLRFDDQFVGKYVFVVDRGATKIGVRQAGDVNGDGAVDSADVGAIYLHVGGWQAIEESISLAVADVNCDYAIDSDDYMLVYNHLINGGDLGCGL